MSWERQIHRSTKTPNPKQQSYSTLTTQSWHHHIQQTARAWKRIGEHMLLKAHEVMTRDSRIKYLSRQHVRVHTHGRRGFKARLPQEYFDSIATAIEMVGSKTRTVPRRKKKAEPTVGQVDQEQTENAGSERSPAVQSWSWKTAVHDQRSAGDSLRSENLSRQPAKPSELDMQDLKQWDTATSGCT